MPPPPSSKRSGKPTSAAAERLGHELDAVIRLASSRRLHQRQASAARAPVSRQGYRLLCQVVEGGPLTPTELARRAEMDPAVVTRQARILESAGLIKRAKDRRDGRLSSIAATGTGRDTVRRMQKVVNRHMRLALEGWSDADLELLADLLGRLVHDLREVPYPGVSTQRVPE